MKKDEVILRIPEILNFFMNEELLNINNNRELYTITNNYFYIVNKFIKDNFNIDVIKTNNGKSIKLNKLSKDKPVGLGKSTNLIQFRYLFLALSVLAGYKENASILWSEVEYKVQKLYENIFFRKLDVREDFKASNSIREFLEEKSFIVEIDREETLDEANNIYLYKLIQTPKREDLRKMEFEEDIPLDTQIKEFLILNGSLNENNNSYLFKCMKDNEKGCFDKVSLFFSKFINDEDEGYYLLDWEDAYVLIYNGYNIYPRMNTNEGTLFIEVIGMLDTYKVYSYNDIKNLAMKTFIYKERSGVRSNIDRETKSIIEKMLYYGVLKEEDDKYIATKVSEHIKNNYKEEENE